MTQSTNKRFTRRSKKVSNDQKGSEMAKKIKETKKEQKLCVYELCEKASDAFYDGKNKKALRLVKVLKQRIKCTSI